MNHNDYAVAVSVSVLVSVSPQDTLVAMRIWQACNMDIGLFAAARSDYAYSFVLIAN